MGTIRLCDDWEETANKKVRGCGPRPVLNMDKAQQKKLKKFLLTCRMVESKNGYTVYEY